MGCRAAEAAGKAHVSATYGMTHEVKMYEARARKAEKVAKSAEEKGASPSAHATAHQEVATAQADLAEQVCFGLVCFLSPTAFRTHASWLRHVVPQCQHVLRASSGKWCDDDPCCLRSQAAQKPPSAALILVPMLLCHIARVLLRLYCNWYMQAADAPVKREGSSLLHRGQESLREGWYASKAWCSHLAGRLQGVLAIAWIWLHNLWAWLVAQLRSGLSYAKQLLPRSTKAASS